MSAKRGRSPAIVKEKRRTQIVRLDSKVSAKLDIVADALGVSKNSIINDVLKLWVEGDSYGSRIRKDTS